MTNKKFILVLPSEEVRDELLTEAIKTLANLRAYTVNWEREYGAPAKNRKIYWEKNADEFLKKLNIKEENGGTETD